VPEAAVEQVEYRVFYAADIEVYGRPIVDFVPD
jgi:hypothetical protein